MKDIGGYFSLELKTFNNMPNSNGILLNSGRNSLEFVLRSLPKVDKVYIPYYTCKVVLEPFSHLGLAYSFYHINANFELDEKIELNPNEYLLYTNYFGIKDAYVKYLNEIYGENLIVDNAQALYAKPTVNSVYSPRKYVGVPDGGIAFTNNPTPIGNLPMDQSYDRCIHLLKRLDVDAGFGYKDFQLNDSRLDNNEIKQMSNLTRTLLEGIDFESIKEVRRRNYEFLYDKLKETNQLNLPSMDSFECPMVYPYMVSDAYLLRKKLIAKHIFVATYWSNIFEWCSDSTIEFGLAKNILPIPIDQRYDIEDMKFIVNQIKL